MPVAARISMVTVGLAVVLAPAASADPGERIVSYDVAVAIGTNGQAHVTETIAYDFGANQRHGITRTVVGRRLAGTATASSPDGAPTEVTKSGNTIRVGDPDTTVTGMHTYVLDYDIDSAVSLAGSSATVNWPIVDGSWDVPVAAMTGKITVPAAAALEQCALSGTTSCGSAVADGNVIRVQHKDLSPHASMRVGASFPSAGLALTTPRRTYTYSTPTYSTPATRETETATSSRTSGGAAFGWVIGLGFVGLMIALFSAAGKSGRRSRSRGGYYSGDTYYSSGGYSSSSDSGSSSYSDSGGGSSSSSASSSSDGGSSSSSGSW